MNRFWKTATAIGLWLALGMLPARPAAAASVPTNPSHEDLLVSFTAALSVKVDGLEYSTRALANLSAGQTFVPSSATVTNDSAGLTEKFQLHALDATPPGPDFLWTVATATGSIQGGVYCSIFVGDPSCPGPDEFAMQALFISSANTVGCPSNTASDWELFKSIVSTTPATFTSAQFADTGIIGMDNGGTGQPDQTTGVLDGNMFAAVGGGDGRGRRGLCVRVTMPSASTGITTHNIRLTVTAMVGN